jgi:hypothetical protein
LTPWGVSALLSPSPLSLSPSSRAALYPSELALMGVLAVVLVLAILARTNDPHLAPWELCEALDSSPAAPSLPPGAVGLVALAFL